MAAKDVKFHDSARHKMVAEELSRQNQSKEQRSYGGGA